MVSFGPGRSSFRWYKRTVSTPTPAYAAHFPIVSFSMNPLYHPYFGTESNSLETVLPNCCADKCGCEKSCLIFRRKFNVRHLRASLFLMVGDAPYWSNTLWLLKDHTQFNGNGKSLTRAKRSSQLWRHHRGGQMQNWPVISGSVPAPLKFTCTTMIGRVTKWWLPKAIEHHLRYWNSIEP